MIPLKYTDFITNKQNETLSQLPYPLSGTIKNLLNNFLSSASMGKPNCTYLIVAKVSLDAFQQGQHLGKEKMPKFERFLITILQEIQPTTFIALNRLPAYSKESFSAFIDYIDKPEKEYYPPQELIRLTNSFQSTKPHVLQNHQTDQKCPSENDALLSELLDVDYNHALADEEKLLIRKALLRSHEPNHSIQQYSPQEINEFVAGCLELKNECGDEALNLFFSYLNKSQFSNTLQGLNTFLLLSKRDDFYSLISQQLNWNALCQLVQQPTQESWFPENINDLIARFKVDRSVRQPLSDHDLESIKNQYQIVNRFCTQNRYLSFSELMHKAHVIRTHAQSHSISIEQRLELVGIACLSFCKEFKMTPYSTQLLALLAILLKETSCQAQIQTGQGKSTIITLWIFVMAMECRSIDVISSARYLTNRDYEKFRKFFKRCDITTSSIAYDNKTPSHFKAQVLYGPAFDFEFAYMQDLLWGKKLFDARLKAPFVKRNFDVVCVDESDNLLVDAAMNGARLAIGKEVTYEWIYAPILMFIKSHRNNLTVVSLKAFLNNHLSPSQIEICQNLSNEQLSTWLSSGQKALFELKEENDYTVRTIRDHDDKPIRKIQIVDRGTGRISENSRWNDGLHEFLEVKHDIVVEKESLTAITLSHAVFYEFYQKIVALTGTSEREQTQSIYHIESFDIPSHQPLQRVDFSAVIEKTESAYYGRILSEIETYRKKNRPILVLCETIQETQILGEKLKNLQLKHQLLNEVQEEQEEVILNKAGMPGFITIATNTAGRGTDIILDEMSLENGGLHVLIITYPSSNRVEAQAVGRAGRQGQVGSSRMILLCPEGNLDTLIAKRIAKNSLLSSMNIERSKLERHLSKKTLHFYKTFRKWADQVEQDLFLEKLTLQLIPIRLKRTVDFNFENLSPTYRLLAEECIRLLSVSDLSNNERAQAWKILLKNVVEALKKKTISEWVNGFFDHSEKELMRLANFNALMMGFQIEPIEALSNAIKREIDVAFQNHKRTWEQFLNLDGSGLFLFLKELTTIDLSPALVQ